MPDFKIGELKIDVPPMEHQREFVEIVANSETHSRFLLSSPPGAGKTAAVGFLAYTLKVKRGTLRCLVIAPAPMTSMWRDQLMRFAGFDGVIMTPQIYRTLQAENGENVNVWSTVSCAVVSIDFLKSADRIEEVLAVKWDLVVLDEAHRSTESSQRGEVAKRIWDHTGVTIAIAIIGLPGEPRWIEAHPKTKRINWRYTELLGKPRIPERRVHTVTYPAIEAEKRIRACIQQVVGQNKDSQFTANLLLRRLNSSMFAFEQTLRELLSLETFAVVDLHDWTSDDAEGEADETAIAHSRGLDRQIGEEILSLLETEPNDSKWECCFRLLTSRGIGKTNSGILFTDFADTAGYLEYLAKSRGLNVCSVTGAATAQAREHALREAHKGSTLLIATAASEGMNLTFTNQIIHYDIPWNPRVLLQRIARVERIGTKFHVFDHYCILESTTSNALSGLMEKLQAVEREWK